MHRAVVDTNVFVSALLGSSTNRAIKTALQEGRFILVTSEPLLGELIEVLSRKELSLPVDVVAELVKVVTERAVLAKKSAVVTACRDPKDNIVLEAALDGSATHIVTGDHDLLALHPFQGVAVVTPSEFSKTIRESAERSAT